MSLLDLPSATPQPLAGRVILLAGAHGGLGGAAAQACAAGGATLVLLGRKLPLHLQALALARFSLACCSP